LRLRLGPWVRHFSEPDGSAPAGRDGEDGDDGEQADARPARSGRALRHGKLFELCAL
jgi:hypothetical protein